MLLLIVSFFLVTAQGNHFPPGVTLCHRSDPNFNKCVGKNLGIGLGKFSNGSKYFDIPVLQPLYVKEMVLQGAPTDTIAIVQKYRNVYMYGISNSSTEKDFRIDLDDDNCGFVMDVETPIIRMQADYELTGKLLMFPLNGHGKCNITLYHLMNVHTMKCEKYTLNGKTHIRAINYTMDMRLDNITFEFENIFPGNEQIGREILKTLNENSLAIFQDVKSGFEQIFSAIHMDISNRFYRKLPLDEIFLD